MLLTLLFENHEFSLEYLHLKAAAVKFSCKSIFLASGNAGFVTGPVNFPKNP